MKSMKPGFRAVVLGLLALAAHAVAPNAAADDGYVVFLSEYLSGDYYVAELGEVDGNNPRMINPRKLSLPKRFRSKVELGNHDVHANGSLMVFAARRKSNLDWDIYTGTIDLGRARISNVERIVHTVHGRDEDPRFSWDANTTSTRVVYKCDGNICIYPTPPGGNPVVEDSECELWAPSFDPSGKWVSYARRCDGAASDRIWRYGLLNRVDFAVPLPEQGSGPDRFAHFLGDGDVVYSHISYDQQRRAEASLWRYSTKYETVSLLHDRTGSDDDPYPDKHDANHVAFIGWQDGGYDLFIYRRDRNDSVQLTSGIGVLAPVLFR